MNDDPAVRTWLVTTRCAAGLAIIALIAAIGTSEHADQGDRANIAAAKAVESRAEEHRRKLFEERRQRFQKNEEQRAAERAPATHFDGRHADLPVTAR